MFFLYVFSVRTSHFCQLFQFLLAVISMNSQRESNVTRIYGEVFDINHASHKSISVCFFLVERRKEKRFVGEGTQQ